jgi:alkaline phosphatase D
MTILHNPQNFESLKPKLTSAAIVGHTTCNTSKLWFRVYRGGIWHLVVSVSKLIGDLNSLNKKTLKNFLKNTNNPTFHSDHHFNSTTNFTHCFDVDNLEPDTRYFYYLIADESIEGVGRRVELGSTHEHWFKTLPSEITSLSFGFYSCHDPFSMSPHSDGAWPRFRQILKDRNASFVIGGGDQVYCDTNSKSDIQDIWVWLKNNKKGLINQYQYASGNLDKDGLVTYFIDLYRIYYRSYWCFENVLAVFRRYPQYMIWDDHEIMDGWGSFTKKERKTKLNHWLQDDDEDTNYQLVMLMFEAASFVYYEYQHSHNPTTEIDLNNSVHCEWDYGFTHNQYAFYMLDVRGHHDCERKNYKLLGKTQFTRFSDWLRSEKIKKAKAIFICSPVPVVHWNETFVNTADFGSQKDDFMDEWGHKTNHKERNKLMELLLRSSHNNKQVITILSGDVHCASAFKISQNSRFPNAKVFNVTSSAISRSPAPKIALSAIQKSAPIDEFKGGRFEQLYRFAGSNNFALINAQQENSELSLSVNLYWNGDNDEICQKIIFLN